MKNSKLKIIGIVLIVGAVVATVAIQALGPGLVVTEYLNQPVQGTDPNVTIMMTERTTYHLMRILSPLAAALVGVSCLLLSRRGAAHAA